MLNKFCKTIIIFLISGCYTLLAQNLYTDHGTYKYSGSTLRSPFIDVPAIRPDFILSVTAGLSLPLADLKGKISDVSPTNKATLSRAYFEKYGFNVGLQGKLPVDKKSRLRVTMSFIYNQFTNSGTDSTGVSTMEPALNFLQFGLGAEWAFSSISDITPYINLEANANLFGGSVTFTDNNGLAYTAEYNHVTRYGFTAAAGIEKAFTKVFGGYFGVKYCMANVVGKSSDLTGARELNDDSYVVNGFSIDPKTISFVGVYLGLSLYIRD